MIKRILLDCDGVLADFVTGTLKAHNRSEKHDDVGYWDYYLDWGMTAEEFWAPTKGWEFWNDLPKYPWADYLYQSLSDLGKVIIVTSPSDCPFASAGKTMWLQRNFGIRAKDIFIGGQKDAMALPTSVLVDDYPKNIEAFAKEGGKTVLFPQPWNDGVGNYLHVIERVEALFDN
jgi:5'(3')-deoxyribonucleotidase